MDGINNLQLQFKPDTTSCLFSFIFSNHKAEHKTSVKPLFQKHVPSMWNAVAKSVEYWTGIKGLLV